VMDGTVLKVKLVMQGAYPFSSSIASTLFG
jgi:hypothetical protein